MTKLILFFSVMFICVFGTNAQVTLTPTAATCPTNGEITIDVASQDGAILEFTIYKLPNLSTPFRFINDDGGNPIVVSGTSYSRTEVSFPSGPYQVVVTEIIGMTQTDFPAVNTNIANNYEPMDPNTTVTASTTSCGSTIVANSTSGNPTAFELRECTTGNCAAGTTVVTPFNPSNTFADVAPGIYLVAYRDDCNEIVTQQIEVPPTSAATIDLTAGDFSNLLDCNTFIYEQPVTLSGDFQYPVELTYVITEPGGATQTFTNTLTSGNVAPAINLPFFSGQSFSLEVTATGACEVTTVETFPITNPEFLFSLQERTNDCGFYFTIEDFQGGRPNLDVTITLNGAAFSNSTSTDLNLISVGDPDNLLADGTYEVTIQDACGNTHTESITIVTANDTFTYNVTIDYDGCEAFFTIEDFSSALAPIDIDFTAFPAGFDPDTYTATGNTLNFGGGTSVTDVPVGEYQFGEAGNGVPPGDYQVTLVDDCGDTQIFDFTVEAGGDPFQFDGRQTGFAGECGQFFELRNIAPVNAGDQLNPPFSLRVAEVRENLAGDVPGAPIAYDPADFNLPAVITLPDASNYIYTYGPGHDYAVDGFFPNGWYTFEITDGCGTVATFDLRTSRPQARQNGAIAGCGDNSVSLAFRYGAFSNSGGQQLQGNFGQVIFRNAPQAFLDLNNATLPFDASAGIRTVDPVGGFGTSWQMNNLPEGTYTIDFFDECGVLMNTWTRNYRHDVETKTTVTPTCTNFDVDVDFQLTQNNIFLNRGDMYLQKRLPSGNWGNPNTGDEFDSSIENSADPGRGLPIFLDSDLASGQRRQSGIYSLTSITSNFDGTLDGDYRIVLMNFVHGFGNTDPVLCHRVTEEFSYVNGDFSSDYFVSNCIDGTNELAISATGVGPFNYQLISGPGAPIDNGTDNIFEGLADGTYRVQVTDDCGNQTFLNITTTEAKLPVIQPLDICPGEDGALFIPGVEFLDIEWFKDGVSLSPQPTDDNLLEFAPFAAADQGLYEAVLSYSPNPSSCFTQTLSLDLSSGNLTPVAGDDLTYSFETGTLGNIDLFNFISGLADTFGSFTELTNSGLLSGSNWDAGSVTEGVYQFEYAVDGTCGTQDTAIITFSVSDVVLPIDLAYFSSSSNDCEVFLEWQSLTETNNSHFIIEVSTDGINFSDLARIEGNGDSTTPITYNYVHTNPVNGGNYYRLRQIDFDGTFEVFDQILFESISCETAADGYIYPNPANAGSTLTVVNETAIELVTVYDFLGRLIQVNEFDNGNTTETISVPSIPNGAYIVIVNNETDHKLIIQ